MAWERFRGVRTTETVYPKLLALPITFVIVMIGWVMFRAPTVEQAMFIYQGMIGLNGIGLSPSLSWQISLLQIAALVIAYCIVWGLPYFAKLNADKGGGEASLSALKWAATPLLVLAVLKLSAQSYTPFLYFQF